MVLLLHIMGKQSFISKIATEKCTFFLHSKYGNNKKASTILAVLIKFAEFKTLFPNFSEESKNQAFEYCKSN